MRSIVLLTAVLEGGLVLLALGLGRALRQPPFETLSFDLVAWIAGALATLPLVAGVLWSLRSDWRPWVRLRRLSRSRLLPLFAGSGPLDLALVSLFAGIGEEALFRGLLLPAAAAGMPVWVALLMTSLLFGAAHAVSTTYAVAASVIGLYLGALFLVSGNLLVPILVHALYDFVALHLLLRYLSPEATEERTSDEAREAPPASPSSE